MKRTGLMLFALCMLFVACENENDTYTMEYPIAGEYTQLDVSSAFDVVVCDTVTNAVVTIADRLQKYVVVNVEDGVLTIKLRPNMVIHSRNGKVLLPRNEKLCEVELSGASSFMGDLRGDKLEVDLSGASYFEGTIQGKEVSIDLSGASDIEGTIDADNIELEASGASTVKATGSCLDELDLDLSGSSDFLAPQMKCRIVKGEMSGSSNAEFLVCESLQVSLSGSSNIVYGIPTGCRPLVNCPTSGSSSVSLR